MSTPYRSPATTEARYASLTLFGLPRRVLAVLLLLFASLAAWLFVARTRDVEVDATRTSPNAWSIVVIEKRALLRVAERTIEVVDPKRIHVEVSNDGGALVSVVTSSGRQPIARYRLDDASEMYPGIRLLEAKLTDPRATRATTRVEQRAWLEMFMVLVAIGVVLGLSWRYRDADVRIDRVAGTIRVRRPAPFGRRELTLALADVREVAIDRVDHSLDGSPLQHLVLATRDGTRHPIVATTLLDSWIRRQRERLYEFIERHNERA